MELLDAIHDNMNLIRDTVYGLNDLADAADVMGNERLARSLRKLAAPLNQSAKDISDAWSDELSGNIRHNEAMFGQLLAAMLHPVDAQK